MNYQVLARKWRPKNFSQVVGQEHVLRALINALDQNRLHHAYLFAGTRGVGKTTIARILSKCFNCEAGVTATPCGKCDACTEIDMGRFIDLIEVDAASRTKVEDTRELLDNLQYLPAKARYKVYLIDEVHMLSGHSFNALLKTLEEPPSHVKFLLATTDPQRLPVTVLSRCLQFNLKALSPELIQAQLKHILEQEQLKFDTLALHQIALAADGSVRDALSLLDQAIAYSQGEIRIADINNMLGTIESTKLFKLITAIVNHDATTLLTTIAELSELAVDFNNALDKLLNIFHQVAILQLVPNAIVTNWDNPELIKELVTKFSPEDTQLYYQIALLGKRDLSLAPTPKSGFEMTMLRILAFKPQTLETTSLSPRPSPTTKTTRPETTEKNNLLQNIKVTGTSRALLSHCTIGKMDDNHIELLLEPSQSPLLNQKHQERLSQAFSDYLQKPITVTINIGDHKMDTPANRSKQILEQKRNLAIQSITNDENIKKIMTSFDAQIIPDSIDFSDN